MPQQRDGFGTEHHFACPYYYAMLCILLSMATQTENWKTQIRKGYLELCILLLIQRQGKLYGFELLERLSEFSLEIKEGTLYPLLNRMSADGVLSACWETENLKGHPRKFYSLTRDGLKFLIEMNAEFEQMITIYRKLDNGKTGDSQ
jgi:PadR family transcriptional regulator PadR